MEVDCGVELIDQIIIIVLLDLHELDEAKILTHSKSLVKVSLMLVQTHMRNVDSVLSDDPSTLSLIDLLKEEFLVIGVEVRIGHTTVAWNGIHIGFPQPLIVFHLPLVKCKKRGWPPSSFLDSELSGGLELLLVQRLLPSRAPGGQDLFLRLFLYLNFSFVVDDKRSVTRTLPPIGSSIHLRSLGTCETAVYR